MYQLIDALIFPAPSSSYTAESLGSRLIYIPKYQQYQPNQEVFSNIQSPRVSQQQFSSKLSLQGKATLMETQPIPKSNLFLSNIEQQDQGAIENVSSQESTHDHRQRHHLNVFGASGSQDLQFKRIMSSKSQMRNQTVKQLEMTNLVTNTEGNSIKNNLNLRNQTTLMNNKSAMGIRGATGNVLHNKQRVLTPSASRPLGPLEQEEPRQTTEDMDPDANKYTAKTYRPQNVFQSNGYHTNQTTNGTNEVKLKGDFTLSKFKNMHQGLRPGHGQGNGPNHKKIFSMNSLQLKNITAASSDQQLTNTQKNSIKSISPRNIAHHSRSKGSYWFNPQNMKSL